MPLPIVYRTGGDVQVNYDFADVISGTGYIAFYLQAANEGSPSPSTAYQLTRQTMRSYPVSSQGSTATSSDTKVLDLDFDYLLDRPLTLSGDAICDISTSLDDGPNVGTAEHFVIVKIRKWDGSTETDLVTSQGDTFTRSGGTSTAYYRNTLKFNIPQTHFKKGDSIRVTAECWVNAGGTGTCNGEIAHSPQAQYWDTNVNPVSSQSVIQIPLRIDI